MFTYWKAMGHNDKTEGRGGMHIVGIFVNKEDAEAAAVGQGVWGHDGEVTGVCVYENYREFSGFDITDNTEEIKKQALGKLTEKERKALGV